jgi:tetratricopeptide (TPR) repeat protein
MHSEDDFPPMRAASPSAVEEELYSLPRRRRVGGWIVAVVLLLAVGVGGWAVARPYLVARSEAGAVRVDPRARQFVTDGERAMSDGNLDSAQEAFDKASALAEHDPRVLLDEARVSAARADVPWLKLRLLPADATEEARTTKMQLDDAVARTNRWADAAVAAASGDPAAARAKLDAQRLAGDREAARSSVAKVLALGSQAETSYVLAALDLAEQDPLWTTVIDRLRTAAAGEGNAGRARAALVYALAKSGDRDGARAELGKLDALTRPYPLVPNLHALVDKMPAKVADKNASGIMPHVDVSALPGAKRTPSGEGASGGESGGETTGGLQAAAQAIKKGDWNRARQVYEALVARNPSDSEALAGIGDVDRAQGNSAGAIAAYKRALAVNPSYLPALLGVADTQWASGDRASAARSYKDIADRFPEGTYPSYVKTRAEEGSGASAAPAGESAGAKSGPAAEPSGL